jgi:hypothetical protein
MARAYGTHLDVTMHLPDETWRRVLAVAERA